MGKGANGERNRGMNQDFWAVTSYFNPVGYRRHRQKYRIFRERLGVPLLTVELAYGKRCELGRGDADCLLQLRSDQVLWQKERLLNLAIQALPEKVRFVAWVDADVVFQREDWPQRAREALDTYSIVQPYSRVHDLPDGAEPVLSYAGKSLLTRRSLGAICMDGGFDPVSASTNMLEVASPGHAWAMARDTLEATGLYDAMILGSGDNAVAMAALGHIDRFVESYRMNEHEEAHYRRWAEGFHAVTGGIVGCTPGDLFHLWHGDLSNRGYEERYPGLVPFRFDPHRDIALDEQGVWRWATPKPSLHAYVASYFRTRREDG